LKYGRGASHDVIEFLQRAAAESNIELPSEDIPPEPEVLPWLLPTFKAFILLNRQRGYQQSGGPQALGISDIVSYHGAVAPLQEVEDFITLICAMDRVYLDHKWKELEKKRMEQDLKSRPVRRR